jgi:hypothetical protein
LVLRLIQVPSKLPITISNEQRIAKWPPLIVSTTLEYGRQFVFPFLPLGFFSRVLVRVLHSANVIALLLWRDGCIVSDCNKRNRALLEFTECCKFNVRIRVCKSNTLRTNVDFFMKIIDAINTLIDAQYNIEFDVVRFIPCTHCIEKGESSSQVFLFTYRECVEAAVDGQPFVFCKHIRSVSRTVRLDQLAPDLAFSNIPLIDNERLVLERVIGRGGFGVVHKGVLHRKRHNDVITVAIKEMYVRKGLAADRDKLDAAPRTEADIQHENQFIEFQKEVFIMRYGYMATLCIHAGRQGGRQAV